MTGLATTDGSGKGHLASSGFHYEGFRRNCPGPRIARLSKGNPQGTLGRASAQHGNHSPPGFPIRRTDGVRHRPAGNRQARFVGRLPVVQAGHRHADEHAPVPVASTTTSRRYEAGGSLDGTEMTRIVRSVAAIDAASGLVTDETTTTTEIGGGANAGSSASLRTLHASILNDTANWCLGRSQAVQITASHTLTGGDADHALSRPDLGRPEVPADRDPAAAWRQPVAGDLQPRVRRLRQRRERKNNRRRHGRSARSPMNWGPRGQLPARVTDPLAQLTRYTWDRGPRAAAHVHGSQWHDDALGVRCVRQAHARNAAGWHEHAMDPRRLQGRMRRTHEVPDPAGRPRQRWRCANLVHARSRPARSWIPARGPGTRRRHVSIDDRVWRSRADLAELPAALGRRLASRPPPIHLRHSRAADSRPTRGVRRRHRAVDGASARGLTATQTDSLGHTTTGTRNAWGRLTKSWTRRAAGLATNTTHSARCCGYAMRTTISSPSSHTTRAA